jgi:hypothetical protein
MYCQKMLCFTIKPIKIFLSPSEMDCTAFFSSDCPCNSVENPWQEKVGKNVLFAKRKKSRGKAVAHCHYEIV